jgi:hypothetical protein
MDVLVQKLRQKYYDQYIACGQSKQYKGYFNSVKAIPVNNAKIYYAVPDACFRPEIYVTIDFTYKFVLDMTTSTSSAASAYTPLVDPVILNYFYVQIRDFASYYFKYYAAIRSQEENKQIPAYDIRKAEVETTADKSLFINSFLNYFFTDVSVTRSRKNIGEATITIRDTTLKYPSLQYRRFTLFTSTLQSTFNQLFMPMLPVMIWARGRYYKDFYFPIFTGYIVRTVAQNTEGFFSVVISCNDILELASGTYTIVNPSIDQEQYFEKTNNLNVYSQPFYGMEHLDMFDRLIHGGHLRYNPDGSIATVEDPGVVDGSSEDSKSSQPFYNALVDFSRSREGSFYSPNTIYEERGIHKDSFNLAAALNWTSSARRRFTVAWGYRMNPYRVFGSKTPNQFTADINSRYEILRNTADIVFFELYVDAWGNIQYHPMRLSNKFLEFDMVSDVSKPESFHQHTFPWVQVIGPEELISSSKTFDIQSVATIMTFNGSLGYDGAPSEIDPGKYQDPVLRRKFGNRYVAYKNPLFAQNPNIGERKLFDAVAEAYLRFYNAKLYTAEFSIIFRPEIEMALPVYLYPDGEIFYVDAITHSISIGSNATTLISGSFGRQDNEPVPEFLSYLIDSGKATQVSGYSYEQVGTEEAPGTVGPAIRRDDLTQSLDEVLGIEVSKEIDAAREKVILRDKEISQAIIDGHAATDNRAFSRLNVGPGNTVNREEAAKAEAIYRLSLKAIPPED